MKAFHVVNKCAVLLTTSNDHFQDVFYSLTSLSRSQLELAVNDSYDYEIPVNQGS